MNFFKAVKNRRRILGMNERNLIYIREFNPSSAKKIADSKLLTKRFLQKQDVPTPTLLGSIHNFQQLKEFDWNSLPNSFVIKPIRGIEGAGIEIFYNRDKEGNWIKGDKSKMSTDDLNRLASEILDGKFTPYMEPDAVMFEERIKPHKAFKYYTYKGTPDVRVIVFNNIPIISYLRLPTKESGGKANMAIGAIGAGIDIANGRTTSAVLGKSNGGRGKIIDTIPGTKLPVSGLRIPYWNKMLEIAIEAQKASGIGFLAVDFLIDREMGPVIVELTARPGLSIQIANQDGLRWRLRKAAGIKVKSTKHGVRIAKDLFGGEIEENIEKISGKDLIGIYEDVTIYGIEGKEEMTKAKIDTGIQNTTLDLSMASKLGYKDIINIMEEFKINQEVSKAEGEKFLEENKDKILSRNTAIEDIVLLKSDNEYTVRPVVEIKLKLADSIFTTKANINPKSLQYKIIVGRKSLSNFLIEPSRN